MRREREAPITPTPEQRQGASARETVRVTAGERVTPGLPKLGASTRVSPHRADCPVTGSAPGPRTRRRPCREASDRPSTCMCIMPRLSPAQGQVEASPEAIRTWERGHPTERRQGFVGIPTIYPCPHDRVMCSHVHIEGSVHMGACQLVLTDARESRNHAENCTRPSEAPPLPCATFPEAPLTPRQRDRSSCSAGLLNRSRCGTGPISMRNWTDLEAEYDRSRRSGAALPWLAAGPQLARSRFAAGPQPAHNPGRPSWSTPRSGRRTPSRRSSRVLRSVPAA